MAESVLKLVTVQTSAFKNLIDGLKDMLFDCNMEVIPDSDNERNGYVKILAVNNQYGMLIHLRLQSINFDEFICSE